MSIVERLGGFWCYKGKAFIWIVQGFGGKRAEIEVVFNRCWVFRDAKCGICKPKLGIYKPYWAVWRIDCNFAASIWASARIDCEAVQGTGQCPTNFSQATSETRLFRRTLSPVPFPCTVFFRQSLSSSSCAPQWFFLPVA